MTSNDAPNDRAIFVAAQNAMQLALWRSGSGDLTENAFPRSDDPQPPANVPPFDHPYRDLPSSSFWKSAVSECPIVDFDPISSLPFKIAKSDRVATAGSCFAQHISRALMREGIRFLQTESAPEGDAARLPVYSARYGNVYSSRQLLQLFQRAYGLFIPNEPAWIRKDGRYVDSFRPNEFPSGFTSAEDVEAASKLHLAAVREMFESCDVFVFTLGLTEVWLSDDDGSAFPLPPGVIAAPVKSGRAYSPVNLSVRELSEDLLTFIDEMRLINPGVRLLLTVSPVPIIATFERRHVIVSNSYTKAVLRIVANTVASERKDVLYFPSYEMIVTHPKARYFDENDRAVKPEGVAAVMKVFRERILGHDTDDASSCVSQLDAASCGRPVPAAALEGEFKTVICDEDMLARKVT